MDWEIELGGWIFSAMDLVLIVVGILAGVWGYFSFQNGD